MQARWRAKRPRRPTSATTPAGYWLREAGPVEPAPSLRGDARADVGDRRRRLRRHVDGARRSARSSPKRGSCCSRPASAASAPAVATRASSTASGSASTSSPSASAEPAALELCRRAGGHDRRDRRLARDRRDADVWFRKAGHLKVATSAAQDDRWLASARACARLGVPEQCEPLDRAEVAARCGSPAFRGGVLTADAATVQPARLALGTAFGPARSRHRRPRTVEGAPDRAARRRRDRGQDGCRPGRGTGARCSRSAVRRLRIGPLRSGLAVTSTHMVDHRARPRPARADRLDGGRVHLDRRASTSTTSAPPPTGGSRSGRAEEGWPTGPGSEAGSRSTAAAVRQVRADLLQLFPGLRGRRIEHAWGGPVDVSPNHMPVLGTLTGAEIHYAYGFTGNGVGPSRLAGSILARMALDHRDELTRLAIVEPSLSPSPARARPLRRRHPGPGGAQPQGGERGRRRQAASTRRGDRRAAAPARDPHRPLSRTSGPGSVKLRSGILSTWVATGNRPSTR